MVVKEQKMSAKEPASITITGYYCRDHSTVRQLTVTIQDIKSMLYPWFIQLRGICSINDLVHAANKS